MSLSRGHMNEPFVELFEVLIFEVKKVLSMHARLRVDRRDYSRLNSAMNVV